jgi:methionyl-tRNA formyltransferase
LAVFFIFYSKIKNGKNFTKNFQVKENSKIQNQRFQHHYKGKLTKEEGKIATRRKKKLYELQEKLYADGSQSLW